MRDFREVSTIELFYDTTKKLEKSTKTYYEIKDRNVRKVSEELHKRISKEIEDDFSYPEQRGNGRNHYFRPEDGSRRWKCRSPI